VPARAFDLGALYQNHLRLSELVLDELKPLAKAATSRIDC
jgi:hypothetical protein